MSAASIYTLILVMILVLGLNVRDDRASFASGVVPV